MPHPSFVDRSIASFVDALASAEPVPGGGSASAVAASLAGSLVAMVAALSDRPRYAEHAALHAAAGEAGRRLATRALELADEDADAYAAFATALKLPRDDDDERVARATALASAARRAAEVPLETVEVCRDVVAMAETLAGRSNANASSDLVVAALLADAAARAAALNVRVNLPSVADADWAAATERRVADLLADVTSLVETTAATVAGGEDRAPTATAPAGPPATAALDG
ncbi:MAG TPA: cyclodeaminase/cyclohydrolase family protein [Candidatus Limnocylindrales bacterium]|nr:cyclodeaminase/cyclohydrolase family protein [Candidatus Limnocylindrales bacterium]